MFRVVVLSASLAAGFAAPACAQPTGAQLVAECDRLAASDLDPNRPEGVAGRPFSLIDARPAIAACAAALKADPAEPRVLFQTGRALAAARQDKQARAAFRLSHRTGYLIATESLAMMMTEGRGGPKEPETARGLLEEAAASGRPFAMRMLGMMTANGVGGPRDSDEARQLFADALRSLQRYASAGSVTAMCLIAAMHEAGLGVPADGTEAGRWYAKAASGKDGAAVTAKSSPGRPAACLSSMP
jgi:TPR repeat protein